ncbi:MAG: DUF3854 domain-containing protein [Candidatus Handelsmanbacteria bacterium]|nr:DUF3854 domain-containing protein [Candidatus Handelsmanbacteria bacterium]
MTLTDHHLADLDGSGLSEETIHAAGLYSADSHESQRLGFGGAGPGLVFPYPSLNGTSPFCRLKPDMPWAGKGGKPAKYLTVKGAGNRLYLPSTLPAGTLADVGVPLLLTEGEKKTLKANQEGVAAIGLPGVWCFLGKDEDGNSRTIPDLDRIKWKGRLVYICFDSDLADKPEVQEAERRLAAELRRRGAVVKVVRLQGGVHGEKVGLDDFLVARGPEALKQLLAQAQEPGSAAERDLARPVDLRDLLATDFPPREWLLDGLLQVRDLSMLHAFRGIGKSRFGHGIAVAVASGGRFLRYSAPLPRGVLLVDGELPKEDLQKMLAQAVTASDAEPTAPLRILSSDLSGALVRSLATEAGRQQVEAHLDGISLLILDSISTLCPGAGPENDAESWEQMQEWLLSLRRRGLTVLLVHHDNRSGGQRGTSKKEDVLSQVVQLRRPSDYQASEGARFEVHLTKNRGIVGDQAAPYEARFVDTEGKPDWKVTSIEDMLAVRAKALSDEGLSQREISEELGVGLGTVNRALKRARNANP